MARNKYPEETVKRILDVAEELFMTKGYEQTTMADIVDDLGGLTKGAIYHHFKSKEDIFEAVFERANRPMVEQVERIASDTTLSGLEKIRAFYTTSADGPSAELWHAMRPSPDPIKNGRLLAAEYRDLFDTAHRYMEPALTEGIADGSITCEHPREVAEALLLLSNLWMVPLFHPFSDEGEFARRSAVFARVADALGVGAIFDVQDPDGVAMWNNAWGERIRALNEDEGADGAAGSEPA